MIRKKGHSLCKEIKSIFNWIASWICFQAPNNLIVITDPVFMWPLSPVKTDGTWRVRRRTTSPYIINETSKAIHPFIQAANTTDFSILPLDMTKTEILQLGTSSLCSKCFHGTPPFYLIWIKAALGTPCVSARNSPEVKMLQDNLPLILPRMHASGSQLHSKGSFPWRTPRASTSHPYLQPLPVGLPHLLPLEEEVFLHLVQVEVTEAEGRSMGRKAKTRQDRDSLKGLGWVWRNPQHFPALPALDSRQDKKATR